MDAFNWLLLSVCFLDLAVIGLLAQCHRLRRKHDELAKRHDLLYAWVDSLHDELKTLSAFGKAAVRSRPGIRIVESERGED